MPDSNVCLPDCGENIENFWDKVDWREDAKWTVYIHTSPSGKHYVGITSQKNLNQRWRNGEGYVKNDHFYRAIQRYTWDAFTHEIIAEHLTKDEACKMEIKLIAELKSNDYHYGYNISSGGEGATGLFGEKNPNYGHHWSEEKRKWMSQYQKEHPIKCSDKERKKRSERLKKMWENEEYRQRMKNKKIPENIRRNTGVDNLASKPVVCLNNGATYVSAKDATSSTGLKAYNIGACCRGEQKSTGIDSDGRKLIWVFKEEYEKMTYEEIQDKVMLHNRSVARNKPVVNVTNQECYVGAASASRAYGLKNTSSIETCCKHHRKTVKGCEWMYYSEYLKTNNMTEEEARKSLLFIYE